MTDRLTRKELKEDTLMRETARAADFMAHHGRAILGGVAVVVVVAAAVFFVRGNSTRHSEQAAGLLAEATVAYERDNLPGAAEKLETLVTNHAGTRSGASGRLLYGDVLYAQGRFEEALGHYREAADKLDGFAADAARRGIAASLENLDRFQEAAAEYGRLTETAPNAVVKAELRMDVARNLAAAGQIDEATAILQELGGDDDNLRVAQNAKMLLAEMSHR